VSARLAAASPSSGGLEAGNAVAKPRSTIGERRGKAKLKPNSTNDCYEPGARNNGKRKERLPEFYLFRTMRECFPPPGSRNNGAHFGETAWSVVLAAGNASEPHARDALAELCQMYWPPIYAYLRQRGLTGMMHKI
jgi:hypothetical protein